MDNQSNNHIHINAGINRKITVLASDIIKKFKTKKDRIAFCKENSKIFFYIFLDIYFPDQYGYDATFF